MQWAILVCFSRPMPSWSPEGGRSTYDECRVSRVLYFLINHSRLPVGRQAGRLRFLPVSDTFFSFYFYRFFLSRKKIKKGEGEIIDR